MLPDATALPLADVLLRLGAATLCGLLLGIEREMRGKDAGLRTHALVSLSSALITTSALSLYATVREQGGEADPLRVIQGLAQAIGFIAAGMIFVARRSVKNLTTAASIWFAASAGIVAGAAQFMLLAVAMGLCLVVLVLLRFLNRFGLSRPDEEEP
ncbi:MgtC/SapB family protein [Methylobacterium nodulans]|uniref:Protein MgtC n=1 Tax=Methylobacterium nodulans (strain LMG 21967 / CNCM I-2342 / ORS 2060) TaxID=460265 RepID=B8IBF5_METNO|nr:MgtC/SapB family protein [Methylobacterium nodulans]ACL57370.1 MgtC/SapB transporter [Methylobacterium nodulans ORS 2060]